MSSSDSHSTLWIILVFVLGSSGYFFWKYTTNDKAVRPVSERDTPAAEKSRVDVRLPEPPPLREIDPLARERDAFWLEMNFPSVAEPEDAEARLAYGLRLLLDPASTEEQIRKGLAILTSHDIREYGGFGKLRESLLDTAKSPDFRRKELRRFLTITERRIRLLRSVLKDRRRIEAFRLGETIPLEGEPWPLLVPEPLDEALYHSDVALPPNGSGVRIIRVDPDIAKRITTVGGTTTSRHREPPQEPLVNGIRLPDGTVRTLDEPSKIDPYGSPFDIPAGVPEEPAPTAP